MAIYCSKRLFQYFISNRTKQLILELIYYLFESILHYYYIQMILITKFINIKRT